MEQQYTVFGLVDETKWPRTLTVAAVVDGMVEAVDQENTHNEETMRFAESYWADSPTAAEELAAARVQAGG